MDCLGLVYPVPVLWVTLHIGVISLFSSNSKCSTYHHNPLPWFRTPGAGGSWLESPYASPATWYRGAAPTCHQKNHSVSPNWAERPRHAAADSAGVVPGSGGRGGRVPGLPPAAAAAPRHLAAVLGSGATRQDAARRTTAVTRSLSPPRRHSPLFRERRRNHGKGKM